MQGDGFVYSWCNAPSEIPDNIPNAPVVLNKAEEAVYSTVSFVIATILYYFLTYLAYCVCDFSCHTVVGLHHVPDCVLENWEILVTKEDLITETNVTV